MTNPFAPATPVADHPDVFGDARLIRKGFLFRVIEFPLWHRSTQPNILQPLNLQSHNLQPHNSQNASGHSPTQAKANPNEADQIRLYYSGWWFWQRIRINQARVWSKISWLQLERSIPFAIPTELLPMPDPGTKSDADPGHHRPGSKETNARSLEASIEIQFGPGLSIRRFQVWIEGELHYDEIH